jgi:hypothetical protein
VERKSTDQFNKASIIKERMYDKKEKAATYF